MSLDISYYRKINNSYNSTETVSKKESDIFTLKQHMINTFSDSLDFHDETLRNTVKQRFVISYYKDENKKKITAFPNEVLNIGDMIDCFDSKWLTTYVNPDKAVYTKGIIQQCNYILPFQTTSSTIISEPCIVLTQSEYTSGENQGNVITLSDSQRAIIIQYNENTKYLVEQKRLFIDQLCDKPKVYKITKADRIYYMNGTNGLLKLTCDEDQTTDKDDISLKIADYISTDPSPTPIPTTLGVSAIASTKNIIYTASVPIKVGSAGTSAKPFVAQFFDTSKNIVNGIIPTWSIDVSKLTTTQQAEITLTYNATYPDRCYVNVNNDSSLIGQNFELHLIDTGSLYGECIVKCEVVNLYG